MLVHHTDKHEKLLPKVSYQGHTEQSTMHTQIIMKAAAEEDIEMRVRRCWLASALVAFSLGVDFFHAGDEILRSKSLDRDSYNSGASCRSCLFTFSDQQEEVRPHLAALERV